VLYFTQFTIYSHNVTNLSYFVTYIQLVQKTEIKSTFFVGLDAVPSLNAVTGGLDGQEYLNGVQKTCSPTEAAVTVSASLNPSTVPILIS